MKEPKRITNQYPPYKRLDTEYGRIGYHDWMVLEVKRLQRGRKDRFYVNIDKDSGEVAIFRK